MDNIEALQAALNAGPAAFVARDALDWLAQRKGPEHRYRAQVHTPLTPRATESQTVGLYELDVDTIRALLADAIRWRHAVEYGFPIEGPQWMACDSRGVLVFGDSANAAIDAAMKEKL